MTNLNIFKDTDEKTLEWIHGSLKNELDVIVQLSNNDTVFLLELLIHYLLSLQSGVLLRGTCLTGDEQPLTWRWINLLIIKSGAMSREEVRERFVMECEVFGLEDEVLSLFDRYIV